MKYFYDNMDAKLNVARIGLAKANSDLIKTMRTSIRKNSKLKNFNFKAGSETYLFSDGFINRNITQSKISDVDKFVGSSDVEANNYDSKFLGRHYIRLGTRPQTYTKVPEVNCGFWHKFGKNFSNLTKDIDLIDVDKAIVVDGCFLTNKVTLQKTMIPEVDKGNEYPVYYKDLDADTKATINHCIRKLRLPDLSPCKLSDMYISNVNYDTKPGFRYEEYLQLDYKREALSLAERIARKRWNYIETCARKGVEMKRQKLIPSFYTIGARNKKDFQYEELEEAKSRAVHMPEFHCEINSSPWVDRITNYFLRHADGPIYIGNNMLKYERFERDVTKGLFTLEGDWKQFDSTIFISRITISLAIMRLFYKNDSIRTDYHFIAMYDTVAIKDYIIPGGYIYRLYHGIPSGVKATSVLGSIVCLLALIYCTIDFDVKKMRYIVGGDDHIIVLQYVASVRERVRQRAINIGMNFKYLKIKNNLTGRRLHCYPTFYKYTVYKGKPLIQASVAIERMLIPWNKKYRNTDELYKFVRDLIPTLGTPSTSLIPFYMFYTYIVNLMRRKDQRCYTVREAVILHCKVFDKMKNKPQFLKFYNKWRSTNSLTLSGKVITKKNKSVRKYKLKFVNNKDHINKIFS